MGDPREIGVELDKQHNPVIGWIWRITHIAVVLLMIINIFTVGQIILYTIFSTNKISLISKDNIVYRIDLDEKVQIDDRVIKFTNIIYKKDGKMNIFFRNYERRFHMGGWGFGDIGTIKDDLGNK